MSSCLPPSEKMSAMLRSRLDGFAAALLDPKRAVPPNLVGPDGEPTTKRFAVYRNNVMVGLVEALVPEGWANFHLPWAALAVAIIALGPGPLSLDALIERLLRRAGQAAMT